MGECVVNATASVSSCKIPTYYVRTGPEYKLASRMQFKPGEDDLGEFEDLPRQLNVGHILLLFLFGAVSVPLPLALLG